jgi:phosphatidylglycerophosphate synthase
MSHNTWLHRIVRVGVRPLVATPVTPNQLTTLRLACGLAATAAFAVGDQTWRAWGAAVFFVSVLLDRADGELARLGGKTSPWGHKYDLVADALCNSLVFAGLGLGLRDGAFGLWAVAMGVTAGLAIAVVLSLVLRLEALEGARAGELPSVAGFDADDAILAVPLLVWLGWTEGLLVAATIGAPTAAILLYVKFRRRLRWVDTRSAE